MASRLSSGQLGSLIVSLANALRIDAFRNKLVGRYCRTRSPKKEWTVQARLTWVRTWVLAAALALSATALGIPAAAAAPHQRAASSHFCGYVNVRWITKGYTGAQYQVTAFGGVSCSLALRLVPRLIQERPLGSDRFIASPQGFKCQTLPASITLSYGRCDALGHVHQAFNWSPRI
jgi:hypothetical protein